MINPPRSRAYTRAGAGFLLACLARLSICAYGQASIEGFVALPKSHSAPVMNKRYSIVTQGGVVSPNPPLAVVYLEGAFDKPAQEPTAEVVQRDFTFIPALLAIQVGTRVSFPNEDDSYHSIFSYSPAKRFDLGRYRSDETPSPSEVFSTPGLITLRCDIHEHMRGLILVLDTPHFTMTDADGRFKLTGLPAGQYVLKAWLNSATTLEQEVELKENSTLQVNFP